jgi:tetraacyldisaccharide 4'-kinase
MLMDEPTLHDVLSGRRRGIGPALLRSALECAAIAYGAAVVCRNVAFDLGVFRVRRLPVPVISVGNVTTGGTGKTPVVAWLIRELRRQGYTPGLLSRGYRRLRAGDNDEARVLARQCPGVPHVQHPDRFRGGQRLLAENPPGAVNVLVLDDGFQHRRLFRDVDLVVIDALRPWGYGRLLPRGLLREPLSGLRRADLVILTRANLVPGEELDDLRRTIRLIRGGEPDGELAFVPTRLVNPRGEVWPLERLRERKSPGEAPASFCGIGNPGGFTAALRAMGVDGPCRVFPDHHHYTPADLQALEAWRSARRAPFLITTLKDLVKIPAESEHIWALETDVAWLRGREQVLRKLRSALGAAPGVDVPAADGTVLSADRTTAQREASASTGLAAGGTTADDRRGRIDERPRTDECGRADERETTDKLASAA